LLGHGPTAVRLISKLPSLAGYSDNHGSIRLAL